MADPAPEPPPDRAPGAPDPADPGARPATGALAAAPDAVRLVVGTLTRWPVRPPSQVDAGRAAGAMLLAPAVGTVLGLAGLGLAVLAAQVRLSALPTAVALVAAAALVSRGLHLDGLADTADGLGSGRPADRALEIMRRGDVGPIGTATVVLVLLAQVLLLAEALTVHGPAVCVVAMAASRLALPVACRRGVPAARAEGLGAPMAGTVPVLAVALATAVVTGLGAGLAGWAGTGSVLASVALTVVLTRVAVRRLGGVTGDVLGWLVELAMLPALLVLAL